MKHLRIESFTTQWGSFPVYLVLLSDRFERRRILKEIAAFLQQKEPELAFRSLCDGEDSFVQLWEEVNGFSLFGKGKILLYDEMDQWKKEQQLLLSGAIKNLSAQTYLLLGAASLKLDEAWLSHSLILDLSKEKPWEKRARLEKRLHQRALSAGKRLSPAASSFLLTQSSLDAAGVEQELQKLICYVGERGEITEQDAQALSAQAPPELLWSTAEKVVWKDSSLAVGAVEEIGDLLALVGSVRYCLQVGQQIRWFLDRGEDPGGHLPKVQPKALSQYLSVVRSRPKDFFKRGLEELFSLELLAKSSSIDPVLLWDRFCISLSVV